MKKILSLLSLMLVGTLTVHAGGTEAGTLVENTAKLSFSVGGVAQTPITSEADVFKVDKKIDFLLENKDTDQVSVVPGSTNQVTTWSITNEGNLLQKFSFTAAQLNGETVYADADTQDSTGLTMEYSTDGGSNWNLLTNIDIAIDATVDIRIKTDIDIARVDGDVMNVSLTATAVDSSGVVESKTSVADTKNEIDIVFAEDAGATGDVKQNGIFVAWGGYIVAAPNLKLIKSSCVLKDPINDTTNPKRIPGATVLYMLDIENSGTSTDATDVIVTDSLPLTLDYGTIGNLQQHDGQTSCSCTDGTAYTGGSGVTNSGSTPELKVTGLTITKTKHNCVSFEVNIK